MGERVEVTFEKTYISSRGPGIAGVKGSTHSFPVTDALTECINAGICTPVKGDAAKRSKATGKKGAEKS